MKRTPGWDAIEINKIANAQFGGLAPMFEHFGWSERGAQMMPSAGRNICQAFGSVENFVREFGVDDAKE